MPEGDVHILGADTHISKKRAPLLLAGGAIVVFLALRSRAAAPAAGPTVDSSLAGARQQNNAFALEFYQAQTQAQFELAQLMASNSIQQQQLNQGYQLAAGINPGLLQQCIPLAQWYNLGSDIRDSLSNQVRNGQLFQSIGINGVCFAPTQMGISGHAPFVTAKSSRGLFSSGSSVTGPAGSVPGTPPPAGDPGLLGIFDTILRLLGDAGVVTPNTVPRNPNPPPTQQGGGQPNPWIYTPPFYSYA